MQPFNRPEDEMREYQALLGELEGLINTLRRDVEDTRASLAKNETELAELLQSQKDDKYQQELGQEIEALLKQWREIRATLEQEPDSEEAKQELKYVEGDLSSATNQKLQDQDITNKQIQFVRSDILMESKHLRSAEEYLAAWETDKTDILKDIELMRKEAEKFKRMYQSNN